MILGRGDPDPVLISANADRLDGNITGWILPQKARVVLSHVEDHCLRVLGQLVLEVPSWGLAVPMVSRSISRQFIHALKCTGSHTDEPRKAGL